MRRRIGAWVGGSLGAIAAVLLAIAYDTSAEVSVLEGGQRHLTFVAILGMAAVGFVLGAILGQWVAGEGATVLKTLDD